MRYLKIFVLHCEQVFEHRARSFVWFLLALTNPLILILFWRGTSQNNIDLTAYYLFLIVAASMLISHTEEDVGRYDINQGGLTKYLLRPFSYFWAKFFEEIPYRILQGIYGLVILTILAFFFRRFMTVHITPLSLFLSVVIALLAYFLSFTFKMIIGFLAFWIIEIRALFDTIEVAILVFAGFVLPITLYPAGLSRLAAILPFSHMIYYPIVAFQGKLTTAQLLEEILFQLLWLLVLKIIYSQLWRAGIKQFTAVGQ